MAKIVIRRDAIAMNIYVLKTIIYQHKNALRYALACAERVGTPKIYTNYIIYNYSDC